MASGRIADMRYRIGVTFREFSGDYFAISGSDGWIYVEEPGDATMWEHWNHADQAMRRMAIPADSVAWVEPVTDRDGVKGS
jgi:hypothetical protein